MGKVTAMERLRLDQRHRGRSLAALLGGIVLVAVGAVVTSRTTPAMSSVDAVLVSFGLLAVLVGALLIVLGFAYALGGRPSTWPIAMARGLLITIAVFLGFVLVPALWMRSMRFLGPQWAIELVSLLYLVVLFVVAGALLREPSEAKPGPSGVSAYGRTLIER
jgi:hypothetical protein